MREACVRLDVERYWRGGQRRVEVKLAHAERRRLGESKGTGSGVAIHGRISVFEALMHPSRRITDHFNRVAARDGSNL